MPKISYSIPMPMPMPVSMPLSPLPSTKLSDQRFPFCHISLSAPKQYFEKFRRWLDFCLENYPPIKAWGLDVRYQRRDQYFDRDMMYKGFFRTQWMNTGDIAVALGKDVVYPEAEVMQTFFHEYGHFLQFDQGRRVGVESELLESDADLFAEKAMKAYLESGISNIAFVSPATLRGGGLQQRSLHTN